jgi:hypothetical protein
MIVFCLNIFPIKNIYIFWLTKTKRNNNKKSKLRKLHIRYLTLLRRKLSLFLLTRPLISILFFEAKIYEKKRNEKQFKAQ